MSFWHGSYHSNLLVFGSFCACVVLAAEVLQMVRSSWQPETNLHVADFANVRHFSAHRNQTWLSQWTKPDPRPFSHQHNPLDRRVSQSSRRDCREASVALNHGLQCMCGNGNSLLLHAPACSRSALAAAERILDASRSDGGEHDSSAACSCVCPQLKRSAS